MVCGSKPTVHPEVLGSRFSVCLIVLIQVIVYNIFI